MNGKKLWEEIEDFLYSYDYDENDCTTYIDVEYLPKAIEKFLDKKIEEIKNED